MEQKEGHTDSPVLFSRMILECGVEVWGGEAGELISSLSSCIIISVLLWNLLLCWWE